MKLKSNIRKFLMKIGFVITLALSFNPVDAFAEPVVISLPVVEETEWVMESLPQTGPLADMDLLAGLDVPLNFSPDREPPVNLFFRLIHYERLIQVHLGQWAINQIPPGLISFVFINSHFCSQKDEEAFVA